MPTPNPIATALRALARSILAQADSIDAQGATVTSDRPVLIQWGADLVTLEEAERRRLAEIAEGEKPRAWVDWIPGVPPWASGDNDPVDEDLLRAFKPFMDAATRGGIEDSAGARFYLPTIKKRAGIGPQASGVIRDEIKRVWDSQWGRDWRADELNIAAGHVPPDGEVARLFAKVYK